MKRFISAIAALIMAATVSMPQAVWAAEAPHDFWPTADYYNNPLATGATVWLSANGRYAVMETQIGAQEQIRWLIDRQTSEAQVIANTMSAPQYSENLRFQLYYKFIDGIPSTWLLDRTTNTEVQLDAQFKTVNPYYYANFAGPGKRIISADGSVVVLGEVSLTDTNKRAVYAYETATGIMTTISDPTTFGTGDQAVVSGDGRYILFFAGVSMSSVAAYLYDRTTHMATQVANPQCHVSSYAINGDGSAFAYSCDSDRVIVVHTATNEARIVPGRYVTSLSDDGNVVATSGNGPEPAIIYSWPANESAALEPNSRNPLLSGDGHTVAWWIDTAPNPPSAPYYTSKSRIGSTPTFAPIDTESPVVSAFSWSHNPKSLYETTTLTVAAADNTAVTGAEYFIGDADPGQGNGVPMAIQGGNLAATFGVDFPTGVFKITVRAKDAVGNWSTPSSDYLVVYDPNGPRMTGRRSVIPSLGNGDVLPGLVSSTQTDKATFAFSVAYNNQGHISTNSDLRFAYATGTHCAQPAQAVNCHTLEINATSIAWLTTQGVNNAQGIFQGTGTMLVDGATNQIIFRITGVDGERLGPTALDQFQIHIFQNGADPDTDVPLYKVNSADIARGNIKIL